MGRGRTGHICCPKCGATNFELKYEPKQGMIIAENIAYVVLVVIIAIALILAKLYMWAVIAFIAITLGYAVLRLIQRKRKDDQRLIWVCKQCGHEWEEYKS